MLADLSAMAVLYYLSTFIDQIAPAWLAYGALWPLYWFFQGAVGTGKCRALVARPAFDALTLAVSLNLHLSRIYRTTWMLIYLL